TGAGTREQRQRSCKTFPIKRNAVDEDVQRFLLWQAGETTALVAADQKGELPLPQRARRAQRQVFQPGGKQRSGSERRRRAMQQSQPGIVSRNLGTQHLYTAIRQTAIQ